MCCRQCRVSDDGIHRSTDIMGHIIQKYSFSSVGVLRCRKGIHTRFEYWGKDVNHDWPWWYKMVQTYLPWFLG